MLYTKNDGAIRTIALLEGVRLYGSATNFCSAIKINLSSLSKWLKDPSINISYDIALKIEKETQISIERLVPDKKEINAYLKERMLNTLMLQKIYKSIIITTGSISLPFLQSNRFIIIGTDGILISGLAILNAHSESQVKALVLDLTSLITEKRSIAFLLHRLLISERIAIGLRIEQLIGNRQGERATKNTVIQEISGIYYQLTGRTASHAAKIIGFKKDTYIRAKQVYLSGDQELINAVDNKTMNISKAAKLIKLAKQQLKISQSHNKEATNVHNKTYKIIND